MIGLLCFVLAVLAAPIRSKMRLEAENAVLRHQLTVLRRRLQGRVRLTNTDRWFLIMLYRWFPSILRILTIIRPETLIHWHRSGFRCYWRWKSRSLGGRPPIEARLRALIRQMSMENRGRAIKRRQIHGQATATKPGMARLPAQSWSRHCRHGLLRRPDDRLRPPLCIRHRSDRAQRPRLDQRHKESDGGMGCPSNHGSISLGRGSGLHDPRPRWYLWRNRHSSIACHGHSEQAYRTGFTLAEWRRRTADRIDPPRVLGSHRRFRRGSSAPDPAILLSLSQRR